MLTRRQALAGATAVACLPALPARAFELEPRFAPQIVPIRAKITPGQLLVVPAQHYLYWTLPEGQAVRYGVGVGKAGLEFKGTAIIQRKAEWPSWRPTDEMIARDPDQYKQFEDGVPGGPTNPLGARALYLYQNGVDTYFRIHGTTAPRSIGRSVSNGCIRMLNAHVKDLYARVPVGTRVTVF